MKNLKSKGNEKTGNRKHFYRVLQAIETANIIVTCIALVVSLQSEDEKTTFALVLCIFAGVLVVFNLQKEEINN